MRLSAFYDIARIGIIDPSAGQDTKRLLAGTGIGLRMKAWKRLSLNLDVATPLEDFGVTKQNTVTSHMRIWYEF
jgi:hemolysin activation/secretion protein